MPCVYLMTSTNLFFLWVVRFVHCLYRGPFQKDRHKRQTTAPISQFFPISWAISISTHATWISSQGAVEPHEEQYIRSMIIGVEPSTSLWVSRSEVNLTHAWLWCINIGRETVANNRVGNISAVFNHTLQKGHQLFLVLYFYLRIPDEIPRYVRPDRRMDLSHWYELHNYTRDFPTGISYCMRESIRTV